MLIIKDNTVREIDKSLFDKWAKEGYIELKSETEVVELTVKEIKAILTEKGIVFDDKAKKAELLELLPQE